MDLRASSMPVLIVSAILLNTVPLSEPPYIDFSFSMSISVSALTALANPLTLLLSTPDSFIFLSVFTTIERLVAASCPDLNAAPVTLVQ